MGHTEEPSHARGDPEAGLEEEREGSGEEDHIILGEEMEDLTWLAEARTYIQC